MIRDQVFAVHEGAAIIMGGKVFGPYPNAPVAERMLRAHAARADLEGDMIAAKLVPRLSRHPEG